MTSKLAWEISPDRFLPPQERVRQIAGEHNTISKRDHLGPEPKIGNCGNMFCHQAWGLTFFKKYHGGQANQTKKSTITSGLSPGNLLVHTFFSCSSLSRDTWVAWWKRPKWRQVEGFTLRPFANKRQPAARPRKTPFTPQTVQAGPIGGRPMGSRWTKKAKIGLKRFWKLNCHQYC